MKNKVILIFIILLAFILRFYNLPGAPPSLSHDEVAIGYNAYSILKTGKDEYGLSFPLLFRSFDDYKLPGMVYLTVPTIAIFGLNELGVRFPSALLGSLSVIVFYFFVKELFRLNSKSKIDAPLIATFFFAISIWHINFSRQSFETNGALFFLLAGTYFLIRFLRQPNSFVLASLFYGISFYFYYSVRIILPFILLTFLILYKKRILEYFGVFLIAVFIGALVIIPLLPNILSKGGFARISTVSVLNDSEFIQRKDIYTSVLGEHPNLILRTVYNRRVALVETVVENYFKNFSLNYIFINGTGPQGLLYLFELPFFLLGIYFLLKLNNKAKWVIFTWFIATPLVGALSTDQPNPLRTLPNAAVFSLFSGLGFIGIYQLLQKQSTKKVYVSLSVLLFLFFFTRFLFLYFDYYPKTNSLHFGDGHKQMVAYVKKNLREYDLIYVTGDYWRPYIYFLFYAAYPPQKYQKEGSIQKIENIRFGKASWDRIDGVNIEAHYLTSLVERRTLFIISKEDLKAQEQLIVGEKGPYRLKVLETISGRFTKDPFYAVITEK